MRRPIIYFLMLLLLQPLAGQDIIFNADYPDVVKTGEQFTIIWTVNTGGGEFSAPSFEGFYKLMGPQTSYSSSTQIINGKISQQASYSYVFYLQAMNTGKFVISPATLRYRNKDYRSDSIHIEVIGDAQGQPAGNKADQNDNTGIEQIAGNDIFLRLTLDRTEVYLGEHIVASIKLYTRIDLAGLNEVKFPAFTGYLKENLETPPLTSLQRENVNGTIYGTGVVQKFLLFPQVTGEINIEPVEITALIQQRTGQTDPFFGDFFASYQTVPKVIISKPVKINVKPLPGIKPDDYSGVVGNIDIKAALSKDTVNVNDAVNFRITVSGSGNLKLAGNPHLQLSPDIEVYDPKVTENIKNNANGSSGQKTYEYLLIPRHYGDYTIPSVSYTYFNTSKKQFEKLSTKEFRFYARKGAEQGTGITVYGGVTKENVKYLGKDIRFIKALSGKLKKPDNIISSKRTFYSIYGFSLLLFFLILFIRREQIRRNSDLLLVRNRKAAKVAGKRLQDASKCLRSGKYDKFYDEILKALWGYLSDKLNIPVSELKRTNAIESLKERGINEESVNELSVILDRCEFARFTPSESGTGVSDIYSGALKFIRTVENSIR